MTDKERVREYKKTHMWYTANDRGFLSEATAVEHWDVTQEQAYLDGLAEGKPKWHDLRKYPNYLPKYNEEDDEDSDGEFVRYLKQLHNKNRTQLVVIYHKTMISSCILDYVCVLFL